MRRDVNEASRSPDPPNAREGLRSIGLAGVGRVADALTELGGRARGRAHESYEELAALCERLVSRPRRLAVTIARAVVETLDEPATSSEKPTRDGGRIEVAAEVRIAMLEQRIGWLEHHMANELELFDGLDSVNGETERNVSAA